MTKEEAAVRRKAQRCVSLAGKQLGRSAGIVKIENLAAELMDWTDEKLDELEARLNDRAPDPEPKPKAPLDERELRRVLYFQNLRADLYAEAAKATAEHRPLDAWLARLEAEGLR